MLHFEPILMTPVDICLTERDYVELEGANGCDLWHQMEVIPETNSINILKGKPNNPIIFITERIPGSLNGWTWCTGCWIRCAYAVMDGELVESFSGTACCIRLGLGAALRWWAWSARLASVCISHDQVQVIY